MKNKKIKTILSICLLFAFVIMLSGCSFSNMFENEIQNKYIDYSQEITVTDIEGALVEAAEIAKASSIAVIASSKNFLGSSDSLGSATILKKEEQKNGLYKYYAVTNYHVVDSTKLTNVYVYNGTHTIEASIVTYDASTDIALLSFETGILLNVATIYKETLKTGQFAIAVGSPYDVKGFYNTVTLGSISAPLRYREEEHSGKIVTNVYIQHDAAINSGNSGGGLFDIYGRLIGINTWKVVGDIGDSYEGLNFAIPISVAVNKFSKYLN